MADKKDNNPEDKGSNPALTTSSSLDKPLLDEKLEEKAADIDTSHLTIDDNAAQAGGGLENEHEKDTPAIDISHLSLEEKDSEPQKPNIPDDDFDSNENIAEDQTATGESPPNAAPAEPDSNESQLNINNPLARKTGTETPAEKTAAPTSLQSQLMRTIVKMISTLMKPAPLNNFWTL
jgi:hypothetical protein